MTPAACAQVLCSGAYGAEVQEAPGASKRIPIKHIHSTSTSMQGRESLGAAMKVLKGEQTFLRVRWETPQPRDGGAVAFEATLCRHHREEVWRRHSAPTGCGQFGHSCDLCEGRTPMRV